MRLLEKRAFTLVELLVTIAVLGIISAMAISQFDEYRKNAKDTLAISLARNLATAVESWIGTDWNKTNIGRASWAQLPNGSHVYVGQGAQFNDYIPANVANGEPMLIWIFVDTHCLLGAACGANHYGTSAGHCDTGSATQFNYHRYYPTNTAWDTTVLNKSSYSNCG